MKIDRFDLQPRTDTASVRRVAALSGTEYTLIYTRTTELRWVDYGLERMVQVAEATGAGMVYSDHFNGEAASPVADYQTGSVRDDFDFGGVQLYRSSALRDAVSRMDANYEYAGLYDLRLKVSQKGSIVHIPEFLYYEIDTDTRKSGEKLFDYVDPKNRGVQIEMEKACTQHLKDIDGYLAPEFQEVKFGDEKFDTLFPTRVTPNNIERMNQAVGEALYAIERNANAKITFMQLSFAISKGLKNS